MMKGLFAYESAFRHYTQACIRDFVEDNIQYAEIRPNFMATNSLKSDDGSRLIGNDGIMKIIEEELHRTMDELRQKDKYFGGMKVIYCTPRSFHKHQVKTALEECINLKLKYKDLLCGQFSTFININPANIHRIRSRRPRRNGQRAPAFRSRIPRIPEKLQKAKSRHPLPLPLWRNPRSRR